MYLFKVNYKRIRWSLILSKLHKNTQIYTIRNIQKKIKNKQNKQKWHVETLQLSKYMDYLWCHTPSVLLAIYDDRQSQKLSLNRSKLYRWWIVTVHPNISHVSFLKYWNKCYTFTNKCALLLRYKSKKLVLCYYSFHITTAYRRWRIFLGSRLHSETILRKISEDTHSLKSELITFTVLVVFFPSDTL